VRRFHPDLPLVIIDGSTADDPCFEFVASLRGPLNMVYQLGYNIGHGRGLHYGLERCPTAQALIFDSDIIMLKSPIAAMAEMLTPEVYGVGHVYSVGRDGFDFGTPNHGHTAPVPYLHPYFALLNVKQYFRFAPFCHHGAPAYKAMLDLYDHGQSHRLRHFAGLDDRGLGMQPSGRSSMYVRHKFGGTRLHNKECGKEEIEGTWQR
jgi:hypothetical protein